MNPFAYALNVGNFVAAKFCTDCTIAAVNGDESGATEEWDREAFYATCETYDITPGHLHSGKWSDCSHAGKPCEDDCDCERDTFSTSACDGCGSSLHGERHGFTLVPRAALKAPVSEIDNATACVCCGIDIIGAGKCAPCESGTCDPYQAQHCHTGHCDGTKCSYPGECEER